MDWENHLEKNSIQKNWKNSENQSEIAACEFSLTKQKTRPTTRTMSKLGKPFLKESDKNKKKENQC